MVKDLHVGELQHLPGCAAWLGLILLALVINPHLPRGHLLGLTIVWAGAGDFLLS